MVKFITKKSATRRVRIKRVEPTHNILLRLKRYIQGLYSSEPILVPADVAPCTLFESLLKKGIFPYQDSIYRITDSMKAVGCQVRVEPPQQQREYEHRMYLSAYLSEKLIFRAKLLLKLQGNVATLTSFLKVLQPAHNPFWQRYKLVLKNNP